MTSNFPKRFSSTLLDLGRDQPPANSLDLYQSLLRDIIKIYTDAEDSTLIAINKIRNQAYWLIGERIVQVEQNGAIRAQYGSRLLENLSRDISFKNPKGFSVSHLRTMRKFYLTHQKQQPAAELSWSHYQLLLKIKDDEKRRNFERQALEKGWSKRILKNVILKESLDVDESLKTSPEPQPQAPLEAPLNKLNIQRGLLQHHPLKNVKISSENPGLAVDCGFSNYHPLSTGKMKELQEGDVVQVFEKHKKKGFKFKKVEVSASSCFTYKGFVERVIDGDTLLINIECGFGFWTRQRIRLKGINSPEIDSLEGQRARQFVEIKLKDLSFVLIKTYKNDKYDRYLADIFYLPGEQDPKIVSEKGHFLNQELLDTGHAMFFRD
jgi:endonuclease YncB( thermonuclease family)